jgi:NAD(P)H-hydrate epimerase
MRALEMTAAYFGVSRLQLMENAGCAVAAEIAARFPSVSTRIAVLCGLGGNGGDGFVAARHLLSSRYRVEVVLGGKAKNITHRATKKNWRVLNSLLGAKVTQVSDSTQAPNIDADIAVDALLGIGMRGPPRQPVSQLIENMNESNAFRVAVDAPTGVDADSGEVLGKAVRADLTVTFHKAKPGLLKAKGHVGELLVRNVGLPRRLEAFAGPGDVALVVEPRRPESHKGDFGRLLIVGGSKTYSGAAALVAMAALRAGVDLVHIAAPETTAYAISSLSPNLVTVKLKGPNLSPTNLSEVKPYLERATAVVIGPGIGLEEGTIKAVEELLVAVEEASLPLLLDADGVKAFARFTRPLHVPSVLTPHAQEFSALTGEELPSSLEEREQRVVKTAAKLNSVVLLKGNTDLISNGRRVRLNFTGNPGMTVGGTGDVLAGIVGALLAKNQNPFEAATAGAFVCGAAGDFVKLAKGYHMVATDLLRWIPKIMNDPMIHLKAQANANP